ncbi:MAG: glycosyltransferase family 4 protein [Coleofasciculus sp. A1-SPW-01]|uniref:glycosyltransferase family 4 protein n=1 Tax=Coleofasciculus sp. A1-SPW-01 TaxID=3070819 RepID=UPI0032F8EDB9
MSDKVPPWICCQLGAREHYAIPRALHQHGKLACLITDAWVLPQSPLNLLPRPFLANLRDRFHPDLDQASVHAFTHSLLRFELAQRLQKNLGWTSIIARNHWFQQRTVDLLKTLMPKLNARPILFAYSYAALELFRYAKTQGWITILGQIDPGFVEETLVQQEHSRHPDYQSTWQPAPPQYWMNWQEECLLADRIIVNSSWSSQALQQAGIPANKMDMIPLAYNPPETASTFVRTYPSTFSPERPMRVLFLGQVIMRKGIAAILEAVQLLHHQPIEFWLVGSLGIAKHAKMQGQIQWIGSIPRRQTAQYYQLADVFLFPTLSDGFGLTQLEAQAWKLPIIASRFCGEVVEDQVNGLILPEITGKAIAHAIEFCFNNPDNLERFAKAAIKTSKLSLSKLHYNLQSLSHAFI